MPLNIETFNNARGGNAFYKAITHPLAAERGHTLIEKSAKAGRIALYDPVGYLAGFAEIYDLSALNITSLFVQNIADIGTPMLGLRAQPVTELASATADTVLIVAFDAHRMARHIAHLVPRGARVVTLDEMRLPDDMITERAQYLAPANFATNFAFFRDAGGMHTRLATANYWAGDNPTLWCRLIDESGKTLADWRAPLNGVGAGVTVDSRAVRERFGLGDFTGQLFLHAIGAANHDTVKYALDTFDDRTMLSCTHDANAWPADLYGGLPAPDRDERVTLWVQNSHPRPIPAGEIGLNAMGRSDIAHFDRPIAPYASAAIDVGKLLPNVRWPQQIEVRAGRHCVRPRYEIARRNGRRHIAHVNVERIDLKPDPKIAELGNLMGKGYLLPAPILPPDRWRSIALPTPMATCQIALPIAGIVIDGSGREVARHAFGNLPRDHAVMLDVAALAEKSGGLASGYGHVELVYDFADGGEADGWLHALFRYEDRKSGHAAETSFGAHIFNTVLTYKNEPQSYSSRPPGLSTRLFLRIGPAPYDTLCHLIYPSSTPWHARSATELELRDGAGATIARRAVEIPCGGSYLWRYAETFDKAERAQAGDNAYVVVRDTTCRLFGYHGLMNGSGSFSFDHMFGF